MGEMADELYAREEMRAWSWKHFCKKETHWTTKDKRRLKPEEMTYTHRVNVIRQVANKHFGGDQQEAIETVKIIRKMYKLNLKEILNKNSISETEAKNIPKEWLMKVATNE